jgi:hypothetical protein
MKTDNKKLELKDFAYEAKELADWAIKTGRGQKLLEDLSAVLIGVTFSKNTNDMLELTHRLSEIIKEMNNLKLQDENENR